VLVFGFKKRLPARPVQRKEGVIIDAVTCRATLANDLAHVPLRHLHARPRGPALRGCRRSHPGSTRENRCKSARRKPAVHSTVPTPVPGGARSFGRYCLSGYRTNAGCSAACLMSSVCRQGTPRDGCL